MKLFFALFVLTLCAPATAQFPTDEEVAARFKKPGVIEVRFPRKTNGEKKWDSNSGGWYWQRGLVVVRKAGIPEYPDATVEVGGLARYFITAGKVSYNKFLVTWNEYKGIPAPSREEMVSMLKKRVVDVVGGTWRWNKMVSEVEAFGIADEAKIEWHTPKSFSVNCVFTVEEIVSYTEIAKKRIVRRIRFYRDAIKSPWKPNIVSSNVSEKLLEKKKYTAAEIRAMDTLGRKGAKARVGATATPARTSAVGATPSARVSPATERWGLFQNALAGFAVSLPGKTKLKRSILENRMQQFDLQCPWDSRLFQVVVTDLGRARSAQDLTQVVRKISEDFIRNNNAQTRRNHKYPYGEMMGRDLVLHRTEGTAKMVLRYRVFAAGQRIWQLMLTSPQAADSQVGFERFCGSFRRLR